MKTRNAVGSLIALLVLSSTLQTAAAGASSDAGFAAQLNAGAVAALKTAAAQKAAASQAAPQAARTSPDFSATPGKLCTPTDPNFKEYRYAERIAYCQRNVTKAMKQQVAAQYGIAQADWAKYEFDHLLPLAIGGGSSVDNLWPQPRGNPNGSDGKDKLELDLYNQMKAGTITQAEAVRQTYAWFRSLQSRNASFAARK